MSESEVGGIDYKGLAERALVERRKDGSETTREEWIARAYLETLKKLTAVKRERDAMKAALQIIAGLEIPKHKLPDLEFCRATAVIAREQARAALQGKPAKEHFDVQPPGDDPQKID